MSYQYDAELSPIIPSLPTIDLKDIEATRATLHEMHEQLPAFDPPDSLSVTAKQIVGEDGTEVEVHVVSPVPGPTSAPGICWIHGGGFVFGHAEDDVPTLAAIAGRIECVAVSVEYRLAPEHPYPAALDDCDTALCWMTDHAHELGIDPSRLAIGGVSAGAGLAAAMALRARDRGGPDLCLQLLEIPEVDDSVSTDSVQTFVDTPLWNSLNARLSWEAYLGHSQDGRTSPYAAPSRAEDLTDLPPAHVVTCEFDPLRDEGLDFARRLIRAGVPTELHHYPGTFHGSAGVGVGTAISDRMLEDRAQAFERAFRRPEQS